MFDKSIFTNNTEPWPNQVFYKDFDCYFFVNYPHTNNGYGENCRPYDLSNNLQEQTVYVSNPDGSKKIVYTYENYNFSVFDDLFNTNLADIRLLFWQGEGEKWAMVSDKKYGVAVYGIDCKYADQIELFFRNEMLSPVQFLEKVGLEKHIDIFMKNYQPSTKMIVGDLENEVWIKHYFQCHVDNENDKMFYWQNFEKLYYCISKLLNHFKSIDLYAEQTFSRMYFMNKQWYSSGKRAPVGGWQNFNQKNCEKVATKFLTDNEHLKLSFDLQKVAAEELYKSKKEGLIEFYGFYIYGNVVRQKTKGGQSDFCLLYGLYDHGDKSYEYNQNFQLSYKKSTIETDKMNLAIEELKKIGFAVKVTSVEQPRKFAKYSKNKPLEIQGIYSMIPDGVTELISTKHHESN